MWRLHAKQGNRLVVSEWAVLPPRPDGEPVSVFDEIAGPLPSPEVMLMQGQEEELLKEFHTGFGASLGRREDLRLVWQSLWDGEKRREAARRLGLEPERVKHLRAQLMRRLVQFSARARNGMAEMLERMGRKQKTRN